MRALGGPPGLGAKDRSATAALLVAGAAIVVPPLLAGAVHAEVAAALSATFAAGLLLVGLLGARWGSSARTFAIAFGLACAASALQLIPLPQSWLAALSPETAHLRGAAGLYGAGPLSLAPAATSLQLAQHAGLAALFLVSAHAAHHRSSARALLVLLLVMGAFESTLALANRLAETRTVLGIYTPRFVERPILGTFVNHNHTGGFLVLAGTPAILLALRGTPGARALHGSLGVLCLGGIVISGTRSGVLGVLVGGVASAGLASLGGGSRRGLVSVLAVLALLAIALVPNRDVLQKRLATSVVTGEKLQTFADAAQLTRRFPWSGIGRGAYAEVAPRTSSVPRFVRATHPECWPLQWSSEWGLPLSLAIAGVGLFACWQRLRVAQSDSPAAARRVDTAALTALAGLIALGAQNLGDFNLEFLGCAAPATVLLGILAARRDGRPHGRPSADIGIATSVVAVSACAGYLLLGAPADVDKLDARLRSLDEDGLAMAIEAHPVDARFHFQRGRLRMASDPRRAEVDFLRASFFAPRDPQPHQALGRLLFADAQPVRAAIEFRQALLLAAAGYRAELLDGVLDDVIRRYVGKELRLALPPDRALFRRAAEAASRAGNPSLAAELRAQATAL